MRSTPKLRPKVLAQAAAAAFAAACLVQTHAATLDINFDTDPSDLFDRTTGTGFLPNGNPGPTWFATNGNPSSGGFLQITPGTGSQNAAMVFKDADAGKIVTGFTFTCDVRIGNGTTRPADGFSLSFARASDPFLTTDPLDTSKLAAGLPEAGTSTGLAIGFDAWSGNTLPDGADYEGVIVRLDNKTITTSAQAGFSNRNGLCDDTNSIQTGPFDGTTSADGLCWKPLSVILGSDGKLSVAYKGRVVLTNFQTGFVPSPGRLVFAGRTGGSAENQHVDNIHLATTLATTPIVSAVKGGLQTFSFQIFDNGTDNAADPATVVVKTGTTTLSPTVTKDGTTTTVTYTNATPYAANSTQTLTIDYKDTTGAAIPTVTRSFSIPAYANVYSLGLNFGASEPDGIGHIVDQTDGTTKLAGLVPDDVAGIAAVAQGDWNNMVVWNDAGTRLGANDGAGGPVIKTGLMAFNKGALNTNDASGTTVSWFSPNTWTSTSAFTTHGENNAFFANVNDQILMAGYLDTGSATTTRITVTNLPSIFGANGYDLYVYCLGSVSGRGGGYRVLTTNGIILKNYQFGDTPASANPTVYTQDAGVSHSDTGNYLKFSGLVARDLVIEATTENGLGLSGTPRAPVNAVQFVAGSAALTAPVIGDINFTPEKLFFTITDIPGVTVDPNSITVKLDTGTTNIPVTITKTNGITIVSYNISQDKGQLFTVATHTLNISVNGGAAVAKTFAVAAFTSLDARWALPYNSGDTNKPGFRAHGHKIDEAVFIRSPGDRNLIIQAERGLAEGYIDLSTGLPYSDLFAGTGGVDPEGYVDVAGPLNFDGGDGATGQTGFYRDTTGYPDSPMPVAGTVNHNYEMEFVTYLQLKQGFYRFAVNSDDGFRVSSGVGQDAAAGLPTGGQILGSFNGGRGNGSPTFFDFAVPTDGVYPFRISYWEGTGGNNIEFYSRDILTGEQHLIGLNATTNEVGSINAFRAATFMRPNIRRALPVQNMLSVGADEDITIISRDETNQTTVAAIDPASVKILINNNLQGTNVTVTKDGPTTTLVRKGSLTNLLASGVNTIQYIRSWTENGATVTFTNTYNINVAPYYGIVPPAYKVPIEQVDQSSYGFSATYAQMDKTRDANQGNGGRITGNGGDGNRMPRPEQQLAGSEYSLNTGAAYTNIAALDGITGTFDTTLYYLNYRSPLDGATCCGMVNSGPNPVLPLPGSQTDAVMPGLPGGGTSNGGVDNYVMEARSYINLKAGVYVFGVNSDDGFVAMAGADPHDTLGVMLGFANIGRGSSGNVAGPTGTSPYPPVPGTSTGNTWFNVIVPEDGIYPLRILYWQGGGGVNAELLVLNKQNGEVALVNDLSVGDWVPTSYPALLAGAPARPWTRFSVSPTPWDNKIQQTGPDPLQIWGQTPGNINSNDIYNQEDARRPWADVGIGGVVANGSTENVRILLDGNDVTAGADITVNGTDKKVVYRPGKGTNPLLASGSSHTASLVYAGGTNSWPFRVQPYITIDPTNRIDAAQVDKTVRGWQVRAAQAADNSGLANTVARAEAQLAGTPVDTFSVKGPGPQGQYYLTNGILNFSISRNKKADNTTIGGVETGNFESKILNGKAGWPFGEYPDQPFPGVVPQGSNLQNFTEEFLGYAEFPRAGYYRFGANGDDGWRVQMNTGTNLAAVNMNGVDVAQTNANVAFSIDRGAGNQDIPFGFVIPTAGIYPLRVVYYQGGGGASFELFSYDDSQTGVKIPVNDPNNPNAIKVYMNLTGGVPTLTFAVQGNNLVLTWTAGATLQSTPSLDAAPFTWTDLGTSGSLTVPMPGPGSQLFYRVRQ